MNTQNRDQFLKQLADQLDIQVTQMEALSIEQIQSLPSNRFREDLIEQLMVAGLTAQEAEIIGVQANINLSWYDSQNPQMQRIIKTMVRSALFGKNKLKPAMGYEDPNLWIKAIRLSLNF